jgi:putative Ca2+/H+ antiporter (TMEM165/GDT1 family)
MHGLKLLATVFGAIFAAQLPGKSALTALVLATRNRVSHVIAGAAIALAAHSAIAVLAGAALSLLPPYPVHVGSGVLFIASAAWMWRRSAAATLEPRVHETQRAPTYGRAVSSTAVLIFIAEWGDLTQLGTAAFAARYGQPVLVFVGATVGLWLATLIAILVGKSVGHLFRPKVMQRVAAMVFAILGAALIAGVV